MDNNIFEDLGLENPEELLTRANLLREVSGLIKNSKLPQREVAEKLGITQPKVSMLLSGKLSAFSTESLLKYLSMLGCEIKISVKKPRSRIGIFKEKGFVAVQLTKKQTKKVNL